MKLLLTSLLSVTTLTLYASTPLENSTCQKCHPKIYKEYQNSMHKNASIYNDPLHKAIWDLHPAKKKGNYKCAKCHTPADHALVAQKTTLQQNAIQEKEPISCLSCHQVESIEKHTKANKNIYTKEKKTFFTADKDKKGTKLLYHDKSSFFGLFKTRIGSPYHDIDYSNENFYNGQMCMGCHSHKQNGKEFAICDLEVKEDSSSKDTCISCHMPKVLGSLVNQKHTKTHAFHGATALTMKPHLLSKYIELSFVKEDNGFTIFVKNLANHTLTPHPLRVSKLKVTIERGDKRIVLTDKTFQKVIGTDGKPSMPWLATEVLEDNLIKAFEKRPLHYEDSLQKGDEIVVEFGYYLVKPPLLKKLKVEGEKYKKFIVLSKKRFVL